MGKMKDALARLAKKVTGKEVEDTNSMSNILEEMVDGFDVDTKDEVDQKINEAVSSVYKYKGSVATYDDLPMTGRKSGDVYNVADTGKNYAYNGSSWDDIGGSAVLVVTDITGLTTAQCEMLNAGDRVIKLTGNQKHTYTVSYKEANVGICLTYTDASIVETVSYDFTNDEWVYNSTDTTQLGGGSSTSGHLYKAKFTYTDLNSNEYTGEFIWNDTLDYGNTSQEIQSYITANEIERMTNLIGGWFYDNTSNTNKFFKQADIMTTNVGISYDGGNGLIPIASFTFTKIV